MAVKYLKVLDKTTLALLSNLTDVTDPEVSEEINREFTASFTAITDGDKSSYINYQNLVEIEDNYFNIVYTKENRNQDDTLTISCACEHVSYDLADDENTLLNYTDYGTPTELLTRLFAGTRFTVGQVDFVTPITVSINEEVTRRGVLLNIVNQVSGELKFEGYAISILNRRGTDRGIQFRYRKNINGISRTVDSRNKINGLPTVIYEVDPIELEYAEGFGPDEHYELGDIVRLIDPDLNIDVSARIIKDSHNPVFHMQGKITISNDTSAFTKDINDTISDIKKASVIKGNVYNGNSISPENGFVSERSDKKARMTTNATEGYTLELGDGLGSYTPVFFVHIEEDGTAKLYLVGNIVINGGTISWENVVPPTAGQVGALPDDTFIPDDLYITTITKNTITTTYINALFIHAGSVDAEDITGTYITGKTVRTAENGQRLSMNSSGIVSYDSDNNKEGIAIENGDWSYSELNFYHNGLVVGKLMYDAWGHVQLFSQNGAGLYIYNAFAKGNWAFSDGTVTGLENSGYATQAWVSSNYIKAMTGGTKTVDKIAATDTGLVIWFTDGTTKNVLYD